MFIFIMVIFTFSVALANQPEDDVGWDKPQKNFSVSIFDPAMGARSPTLSHSITWLNVQGLENTWDRSSIDRKIFAVSMMMNLVIGNLFR